MPRELLLNEGSGLARGYFRPCKEPDRGVADSYVERRATQQGQKRPHKSVAESISSSLSEASLKVARYFRASSIRLTVQALRAIVRQSAGRAITPPVRFGEMAELVEGARLEIVFRLTPDVGSNPTLSAQTRQIQRFLAGFVFLFSSSISNNIVKLLLLLLLTI